MAALERSLGGAALVVGRGVARAARVLPHVVRRASGLAEPSPEATVAGVVRGVTALAPMTMGGIGGAGLELAGAGAVLAIASLVLAEGSESDAGRPDVVDAIVRVEQHGLCDERTASLWRAMVGIGHRDRRLVEHALVELTAAAARALSPESLGLRLARAVIARHALRAGIRGLELGLSVRHAWVAMGEAARLVDGVRCLAAERPLDASLVAHRPSLVQHRAVA